MFNFHAQTNFYGENFPICDDLSFINAMLFVVSMV